MEIGNQQIKRLLSANWNDESITISLSYTGEQTPSQDGCKQTRTATDHALDLYRARAERARRECLLRQKPPRPLP